ncbi:AAA family ATPase [Flavobacterium koreense]
MIPDLNNQKKKNRSNTFGNNLIEQHIVETIKKNLPTIDKKMEERLALSLKEQWKKELNSLEKSYEVKFQNQENILQVLNRRIGSNDGNLKAELKKIKGQLSLLENKKTISIVVNNDGIIKDLGTQHYQFRQLLKYVQTKENIYLVGSAGSGKTTACQNIAKALNIPFYFTGAINSEYKLTGFINAQGTIVSTEFRKAYENGGLFLFDEIDASMPGAILAFNAALANNFMDFPDKKVPRHKDFYCIAAANTFGSGADRQYVGRNQLDAASLDRFIFLNWEIDEDLEREIAKNEEWVTYVQRVRKSVKKNGLRLLISPRASIKGAKLLDTGISRNEVENAVLWCGLDENSIRLIKNNL